MAFAVGNVFAAPPLNSLFCGLGASATVSTKLTWDDLLIEAHDLDADVLEHGWAWLVKGQFSAIAASKFGDWFLLRPNGAVEMLDAIEGTLEQVASSHAEFKELINTQEKQEKWLLSEFVFTLHENDVIPARGECYSFKLPLILGGNAELKNVEVCDFRLWVSICGQIHEESRRLPEGTRISGFRTEE